MRSSNGHSGSPHNKDVGDCLKKKLDSHVEAVYAALAGAMSALQDLESLAQEIAAEVDCQKLAEASAKRSE